MRRFDLALVIDTTGSMSDELSYLQVELQGIVDALRARHPELDIRIGLVAYRDRGDEYVTHTVPLTRDLALLRGRLAEQRAGGGGDYPEAVEQAMGRAALFDWRADAAKSLLFVADAPPHAEDVAATWASVEALRANRVQLVPVAASGVASGAEYLMRAMAAASQGRYLFLTDDSGVGDPARAAGDRLLRRHQPGRRGAPHPRQPAVGHPGGAGRRGDRCARWGTAGGGPVRAAAGGAGSRG